MSKSYVLAPGYVGAQFWNGDKSDLVEIRRQGGGLPTEVPGDIPEVEAKRLLDLGAIVEADSPEASASPSPAGLEEPAGNAGRDEWAAYADSLGLTVGQDAKRDDIKQLVADSRS